MKKLTLQMTIAAAGLSAVLALSKSEPPKANDDCQPPPDAAREPEKIKPPKPIADITANCPCGCTCGADCRCALAGPCSASCECGFAWYR